MTRQVGQRFTILAPSIFERQVQQRRAAQQGIGNTAVAVSVNSTSSKHRLYKTGAIVASSSFSPPRRGGRGRGGAGVGEGEGEGEGAALLRENATV